MAVDGREFRASMMTWLNEASAKYGSALSGEMLRNFTFRGQRIALIGQQGIRKPAGFTHPISIRTTFTPPNALPPYHDSIDGGGLETYKYRGSDPDHPENRALRACLNDSVPLVWFVGISSGVYLPYFPVFVVADDPELLQVTIAPLEGSAWLHGESIVEADIRRSYAVTLAKQRLHQPLFRERVLAAYRSSCTICGLRHRELLDAAHIVPDSDSRGLPIVPNGVSLCKIHHGAYDADLLGITPDYIVQIRDSLLQEHDGPMLLWGLQRMHGKKIDLPRSISSRPDRQLLEIRFEKFAHGA